jgi:hypothetical protein
MPDRVTVQVPRPVGVSRTPGEDAGKNFAHGAENVANAEGTRYGRFSQGYRRRWPHAAGTNPQAYFISPSVEGPILSRFDRRGKASEIIPKEPLGSGVPIVQLHASTVYG